ncbi:MAG: glycosyltransferase family 2 protein [Pseudomonadota bacterium]
MPNGEVYAETADTVALIPAHNEAQTIRAIAEAARPHVDGMIVIDDGSTDGTSEALAGLPIRLIRHSQNAGKGPRLAEGLAAAFAAGAAQVVTLDGDGQHDPGDIPAFRAAARGNPGALILGDRSAAMATMPQGRARSIRFGNLFIGWACGRPIADAQCGMRLYPRQVWQTLSVPRRHIRGFVYETAVLLYAAEAGAAFATVPIPARYAGFQKRPSHFRPVADFLLIAWAVTQFLVSRGFRVGGLLTVLGLRKSGP